MTHRSPAPATPREQAPALPSRTPPSRTPPSRTAPGRPPPEETLAALHSDIHLACVAGPDVGAVVALGGPRLLGRDGDVALSAPSASRHHALVTPLPPTRRRGRRRAVALVEDLGSVNGTQVRHPGALGGFPRSRQVPLPRDGEASGPRHRRWSGWAPGRSGAGAPGGTRSGKHAQTWGRPHAPGPDVPGPHAPGPDVPGPHAPGRNVPGPHAARPGQQTHALQLGVGSRLRIGEDVFEIRERPDLLCWPGPRSRPRPSPATLLPLAMMVVFLGWRLAVGIGVLGSALVAGVVTVLALLFASVLRLRRSRSWAQWDAARLALVLASLHGPAPAQRTVRADTSPDPTGTPAVVTSAWVWPGRVGPTGAVRTDLDPRAGPGMAAADSVSAAPFPRRTNPLALSAPAFPLGVLRADSPETALRRPGLVGAHAGAAALWWCAQIAARTGGVTLCVPPTHPDSGLPQGGGVFMVGDGSTLIHLGGPRGCHHCGPRAGAGEGDGDRNGDRDGRPLTALCLSVAPARTDPPSSRWQSEGGPSPCQALHLGVAAGYADLPSWCDRVIEDPHPPVSHLWWRQVSRSIPSRRDLPAESAGLPARVLLSDLKDVAGGAPRSHGLHACIGVSQEPFGVDGEEEDSGGPPPPKIDDEPGHRARPTAREGDDAPTTGTARRDAHPVSLDLVRDGPHALVAGTTGSGKSEALATWLVELTRGHSPDALRLVLIDYKGGATLSPFGILPHTEAVLTDLDPAATDRALAGLGALLLQRERDLARTGASDLQRWERLHARGEAPAPPPRVVIVVDEFRVLADSHPTTLDTLVRLAAQGRSLGLHLIAATQRPAGALTPAMRANIEIRLALRCAEDADSLDLLGSTDAARLPRTPGRAVLRGHGVLQVAWIPELERELAGIAARWSEVPAPDVAPLWPAGLPTSCTWEEIPPIRTPAAPSPGPLDAGASRAPALGIPTADPVAAGRPHADPPGGEDPTSSEPTSREPTPVSLALADRIGGNGDSPLAWRCGSIGVEGPSHLLPQLEATTLAIASRIASTRHLPLHVCSSARERSADASTWIPPEDPGAVALLMEGILAHAPAVLALTDPHVMVDSLDRGLGPGSGRSWWARLLAGADRAGLVVVVLQRSDLAPGTVGAPARLPHRLIQLTTVEDALRAGLPSAAPTSHLPGRLLALGFHEHGAGPLRCQVPLEPPPQGVPSGDEGASAPATTPATTPGSAPATTHHRSVEQRATGAATGGTTAPRRLSGDGRTWSVRAEPGPDERLPDWALAWAGAGLEPLQVVADQDWVVVAHDPGPALARLELLARTQAGTPRAPGHVAGAGQHEGATPPGTAGRTGGVGGHRDSARRQAQGGVRDTGVPREAAAAHGTGSDVTLPDGTGVTLLPPSRWAQVAALRGHAVLALDPGPELLGVLAAGSRQASQALRAFRWGPCSGVLAISGQLIRIVLPPAPAGAGGPRQGPDPAGAGHSP